MYAAIRQGKARAGAAEELARTIKEEAIPIIWYFNNKTDPARWLESHYGNISLNR